MSDGSSLKARLIGAMLCDSSKETFFLREWTLERLKNN